MWERILNTLAAAHISDILAGIFSMVSSSRLKSMASNVSPSLSLAWRDRTISSGRTNKHTCDSSDEVSISLSAKMRPSGDQNLGIWRLLLDFFQRIDKPKLVYRSALIKRVNNNRWALWGHSELQHLHNFTELQSMSMNGISQFSKGSPNFLRNPSHSSYHPLQNGTKYASSRLLFSSRKIEVKICSRVCCSLLFSYS